MLSPKKYLPSVPDAVWFVLIALAVFTASSVGLLTKYQNSLTEIRADYSQRAANGDIVFLGIDKQSLDHVGVWPWPRSVYAQIIDRLIEMNVTEIGIDVDFSAASNPENDRILAKSLENAGGAVILPVFLQDRSADKADNSIEVNRPLAEFAKHGWLASVAMMTDSDGIARRFPSGILVDGEFLASMPTVLSGEFSDEARDIAINFSIDPATIPSFSVADLLAGKIDPSILEGKTILLGAQAVELRDNFAVPLYGSLSGAILQILAAETLVQGISLAEIAPLYPLGLLVLMTSLAFLVIKYLLKWDRMVPKIAFFVVAAASFEGLGLYLYQTHSLILPTAELHLFIVMSAVLIAVLEMDLQHWLLVFAAVKTRNTENVLNQVVKDNASGVIVVDEDGSVLNINDKAKKYFALPDYVEVGSNILPLLPQTIGAEIHKTIQLLKSDSEAQPSLGVVEVDNNLHENMRCSLEYSVTASQLDSIKDNEPSDRFITCITASDNTIRLAQESLISYHAKFDGLTGALRRNEFHACIMDMLGNLSPEEDCVVYAFNLHRFKTINVALGRDVGDEVLKAAKERAVSLFDGVSNLARLGGDTFAFAVSCNLSSNEVKMIAEHLIVKMNEPFLIGKSNLTVGLRVGVATSSQLQDLSAARLIENVEVALDEAGKTSGNGFVMHEEIFTAVQDHARSVENDLWKALDLNQMQVHYQPQVNMTDCSLIGVEALVRWTHPKLGFVSPADFVEIAEANGFIDELGRWVLNKACEDALLLPDHVTVAVNVSPAQFKRVDIAQMVDDALRRTGLPARRLHIEITEAGFLDATDDVVNTLNKLRQMGIHLALDDFGTGFSSLGYFTKFPINKIKVDQVFVRTLERGSQNEAIIRSVKELAVGLDLKMICEGVETQEQLEILREMGVHEGQGYFFSKPQPIHKILEYAMDQGDTALERIAV
jgi:diguanylate cyclase (GGDEF)-like protein